MNSVTLGKLLETDQGRDAIHIAIAPVVAAVKLAPGQDVGFTDNTHTRVGPSPAPIGIIDPFLKVMVFPDERCWLLLYPNTITALRHEWTHPAFEDKSTEARIALEAFAAESGLSYEELMAAANEYLLTGDYLCQGSRWESHYMPDDFWDNFQVVTGRTVVQSDRGSFFSCSC